MKAAAADLVELVLVSTVFSLCFAVLCTFGDAITDAIRQMEFDTW